MQFYKELSSYLTPIYFSLQLPQLFLIMFPFHFFLNYPAETSLSSVSVATCARLWGHTLDMGNLTVATPSVKDGSSSPAVINCQEIMGTEKEWRASASPE